MDTLAVLSGDLLARAKRRGQELASERPGNTYTGPALPRPPRITEVREYVFKEVESFINDPPANDWQSAWLDACLTIAREALKADMTAYPYKDADDLLEGIGEIVGPSSPWPRNLEREAA